MITRSDRSGFSLVEVIIAMLILSMGVLAMGASTGYVMNQIQASELRTERMATVRQAAEILGGTEWSALPGVCADDGLFHTRHYRVDCELRQDANVAVARLITVGPGFRAGRIDLAMEDTFAVSIAEPVQ